MVESGLSGLSGGPGGPGGDREKTGRRLGEDWEKIGRWIGWMERMDGWREWMERMDAMIDV